MMLQSPLSPESPYDGKDGARAFTRIHNHEAGLEVAAHQNREKSDLGPVVVLDSPDTPVYVNHGRWEEAPQVIDTTAPQAMGDAALESTSTVRSGASTRRDRDAAVAEKGPPAAEENKEAKRWCGLSAKILLLILLLVLLLVAAVIGGAVGGTKPRKNKSTSEESNSHTSPSQSSSSENTKTPSPTKTSSSSSGATESPHVRFRLQIYEETNFEGSSQLFTEPGLYQPAFEILSYIWINSKEGDLTDPTPLLRCSVAFCLNDTTNGWRGASDMRQTGEGANYKHDTNFIHIGCDLAWVEPACRDLGLDKPEASKSVATIPVMETPFNPTPTKTEAPQETEASTTRESSSSRITQRPSSNSISDSGSSTTSRTQTG